MLTNLALRFNHRKSSTSYARVNSFLYRVTLFSFQTLKNRRLDKIEMTKSSRFFLLYAVCCLTSVAEVKSEHALVFDVANRRLEDSNDNGTCSSDCLLACPASDQEQGIIDKSAAVSETGIYMRSKKIASSNSQTDDQFNINVCEKAYKPVMVRDTATLSYETGYELFYKDEEIKLQCKKYDKFEKVAIRKPIEDSNSRRSRANIVSKTEENENFLFKLLFPPSSSKWKYFWISVLSIRVSEQHRQISFAKDKIDQHRRLDEITHMCKDYSLEDPSDPLPSQKWKEYQKTSEQPSASNDEKNKKDSNNEEENPEITKVEFGQTQIMPLSYFHTPSAGLATCTYLNVAYVVNIIADDRLRQVDQYLYKMYRTWPSQIDIIFGVAGTSKEAEATPSLLEWIQNINKRARLEKFPITIPAILFRIVEYNVDGKMYNAIVVVHNIVASVKNHERVCSPESELTGWNGLGQGKVYKNLIHPTGLTYTCPVTSETIQIINANYEKMSDGSLNLDEDQQKVILQQNL